MKILKKLFPTLLITLLLTGCQHEEPLIESLPSSEEHIARHEDGRALVTISSIGLTSDMEEAIVLFNKENDDYYVEVYGTDVTNFWEREMIELSTGKGPDLFCKTLQSSFTTCIEKGLMEDLMPYIKRDLSPEDFLNSSLYAYADGEKVYALETSFSVSTLVGDRVLLGDRTGWTFAEMKEIMDSHSEITLFENQYLGAGEFLRTYLFHGNADYSDYDTLRAVLEFDKTPLE